MSTLRELIFAGINFHEFREFLTISRKLISAKWELFVREKNNFAKYFLIKALRLDNPLT